jgi:hypothetical protein
LREKVAREAGRVRGFSACPEGPFDPSSVGFAATFSRKGRRKLDPRYGKSRPANAEPAFRRPYGEKLEASYFLAVKPAN